MLQYGGHVVLEGIELGWTRGVIATDEALLGPRLVQAALDNVDPNEGPQQASVTMGHTYNYVAFPPEDGKKWFIIRVIGEKTAQNVARDMRVLFYKNRPSYVSLLRTIKNEAKARVWSKPFEGTLRAFQEAAAAAIHFDSLV